MSALVHPHSMPREPRASLRLLERPAKAARPRPASADAVPASAATRPDPWLDRQLRRLAVWAESHTPAHRLGSWMRPR